MPPRSADPPTGVVLRHHWCLHCLRTAVAARQKTSPSDPEVVAIDCRFAEARTKRCIQCDKRNDTCVPVSAALSGDAADLCALLRFLDRLMNEVNPDEDELDDDDDEELGYLFSSATRHRIGSLSVPLLSAFDHAEAAHRVAHGLTGAVKAQRSALAVYQQYIVSRQQLLATQTPAPAFGSEGYAQLRAQ